MAMIPVTNPYLPDRKKLQGYIDRIWDSGWLTNNGPLVRELEARLANFLGVDHLILVANGTLALQVALRVLDVSGGVVTTPFTFVATSAAIRNEGLRIRYADIDLGTLNLDPEKAEDASGPDTTAVVPVHVYGNPCNVEAFEKFAQRKGLKLLYDASHAFGVDYDSQSLLRWGDAATLSLHATKLFHTAEGGAIVFRREEDHDRARQIINFGIESSDGSITEVGMNAKMSEFHAAVGLSILDDVPGIVRRRRALLTAYENELSGFVNFPEWSKEATRNGAYAPILLSCPKARENVRAALSAENISSRPYFSPSLDTTTAYKYDLPCANSNTRAGQILCLPISDCLTEQTFFKITKTIKQKNSES